MGEIGNCYRLIYLEHGTLRVDTRKRRFDLAAGQLLLLPPKEYHVIRAGQECPDLLMVTFSGRSVPAPLRKATLMAADERIHGDLENIICEAQHSRSPSARISGSKAPGHGVQNILEALLARFEQGAAGRPASKHCGRKCASAKPQ